MTNAGLHVGETQSRRFISIQNKQMRISKYQRKKEIKIRRAKHKRDHKKYEQRAKKLGIRQYETDSHITNKIKKKRSRNKSVQSVSDEPKNKRQKITLPTVIPPLPTTTNTTSNIVPVIPQITPTVIPHIQQTVPIPPKVNIDPVMNTNINVNIALNNDQIACSKCQSIFKLSEMKGRQRRHAIRNKKEWICASHTFELPYCK